MLWRVASRRVCISVELLFSKRELRLNGRRIGSIQQLDAFECLERLNLDENCLHRIEGLEISRHLQHLSLARNKLTQVTPAEHGSWRVNLIAVMLADRRRLASVSSGNAGLE
jgi:hypothetical protein